jgi:hypothetical protein
MAVIAQVANSAREKPANKPRDSPTARRFHHSPGGQVGSSVMLPAQGPVINE